VIKIVDEIMCQLVVRRLAEPNPDSAMKHHGAVVNVTIADFIGLSLLLRFVAERGFANLKTAGAQFSKITMADSIALRAAAQLEGIVADVFEETTIEGTLAQAFAPNRPGHANGCL